MINFFSVKYFSLIHPENLHRATIGESLGFWQNIDKEKIPAPIADQFWKILAEICELSFNNRLDKTKADQLRQKWVILMKFTSDRSYLIIHSTHWSQKLQEIQSDYDETKKYIEDAKKRF